MHYKRILYVPRLQRSKVLLLRTALRLQEVYFLKFRPEPCCHMSNSNFVLSRKRFLAGVSEVRNYTFLCVSNGYVVLKTHLLFNAEVVGTVYLHVNEFFLFLFLTFTWPYLCEGVVSWTRGACLNSARYLGCRETSAWVQIPGFAACPATCSLGNEEWLHRRQPGVACFLSLGSVPVRPSLHPELPSEG